MLSPRRLDSSHVSYLAQTLTRGPVMLSVLTLNASRDRWFAARVVELIQGCRG